MQKLKLLIIDDDADQRELIRDTLLDHFGHAEIVCVANAASTLRSDLGEFDLILMDYDLPDTTGMELLEEIKRRCSTPVVMVTGQNIGQMAAEAIRRGATDYVVKLGDYLETIPLVVEKDLTAVKLEREKEALQEQLKLKNTALENALAQVEAMAATDPLTGLYNRRHFSRVLDQMFAQAERCDRDLACAMIDLDGYKQLNDTFGHQLGDQLLVLAGRVILANLRRMDVAARYGGDEFVLLLPHAGALEAAGIVERIRSEYRKASAAVLGADEGVAMSVGVASLKCSAPSAGDQLVSQADTALYRAKDAGRDRISVATSDAAPAGRFENPDQGGCAGAVARASPVASAGGFIQQTAPGVLRTVPEATGAGPLD